MLIDESGAKKGIISISDAIEAAKAASLDLVQVSPKNTNPVVCKLLDYGKHLFDKKKSMSASKSKLKEILQRKSNLGHPQMWVTIILN